MELCIVTPTRNRWRWLRSQAEALAPQLADGDLWVVVADSCPVDVEVMDQVAGWLGERMAVVELSYARRGDRGCVNRARNVGTQFAKSNQSIVEVDDHDIVTPGCLDALREAIGWAGYVYGDCHQEAVLRSPGGDFQFIEPWPDVTGEYGCGGRDVIGVRAFRKQLWDSLGGWREDVWPGGDWDFFQRAAHELEGVDPGIVHLEQALCTVLVDADSISGHNRSAGEQATGEQATGEPCRS